MSLIQVLLAALLAMTPAHHAPRPELHTEPVAYADGDTALVGYLAYDSALTGKRPGVLIAHEWKGHGEYVQRRAREIASLGYVALALDMYGKGVYAKDHEEAGKLMAPFLADRALLRRRAKAALDVLTKHERVDATKIVAMGYCFGGATALELARAGLPLRGVASFHGNLSSPTPADATNIKARVIVFHGADDGFINTQITGFQKEMRDAHVDWQFVSFGGAVHGFTVKEAGADVKSGMAYDEKADRRSWEMLKLFLTECFN